MCSYVFKSNLFQWIFYQNLTLGLYPLNKFNYQENILMIDIEYCF